MEEKLQKVYYSIKEIKELFGDEFSESSLLTMVKRGDIPSKRFMNKIFVPRWWVTEQLEAMNPPQKVILKKQQP